jgi:hypothetical protein
MAKLKGTTIVSLRGIFKKNNLDADVLLKEKLSPELYTLFKTTLNVSWVPIESTSQIIEAAAEILYPLNPQKLFLLGKDKCENDFKGMYKILLPLFSMEMIFKQYARIFKTYHDTGSCSIENIGQNSLIFFMHDYSECTPAVRQIVKGFCFHIAEMAGKKRVQVLLDEKDLRNWKYLIKWE